MNIKLWSKRKLKRFKKTKIFVNRKVTIGCISIFLIFIGFCLFQFVCLPRISLKGDSKIVLNYQEKYIEKGYFARHLGRNITKDVVVSGKVKSNSLGTYKIQYKVGKGIFSKTVTRTVIVRDEEPPTLEIDNSDIYICPGDEVVPQKVHAMDNYDGDVSKWVKSKINRSKSKITYSVTDRAGNTQEVVKKI